MHIHGSASFSWFGEREDLFSRKLIHSLPASILREHLVSGIQRRLYGSFYCQGTATRVSSEATYPTLSSADSVFQAELSRANQGEGHWEDGWFVQSTGEQQLIVHQNELTVVVNRGDCQPQFESPLRTGAAVSIRKPKELTATSPGFYLALGNAVLSWEGESELLRFYWNLAVEGAAPFVTTLTTEFNQVGLPFRLKAVSRPARFNRCDPLVLYLHKADYDRAREILERIYPRFVFYLRRETPVFTKVLARGLGLAEDVGGGASFGWSRCAILAEGIVRAHERRKRALSERLEVVVACFRESGIRVDQPYLNPGSEDTYDFIPAAKRPEQKAAWHEGQHGDSGYSEKYLQVALEIGWLLARRAIWHEDRCNWMAIDMYRASPYTEAKEKLAYRALGPEMYAGASGIALFLAELHTSHADGALRQVAIGATRQALALGARSVREGETGLFSGVAGIVFVSAYAGRLLGEEALVAEAGMLLQNALQPDGERKRLDLISGNAGRILALLLLAELLADASLVGHAAGLGDELMQHAEREPSSCSWRSANFPDQQPLTGFSHGTAGIAYALLELFRATGQSEYRLFAEMAFNYERDCFDKAAKNWPDFRGVASGDAHSQKPRQFPVFWCHGAPGISLSRLRAYQILGTETYKTEALTALRTTRGWTEEALTATRANFSLCHGLAGNSLVLLDGARILGGELAAGRVVARKVALGGIVRYARRRHSWPFGQLGNRAPGLMTGLAGVGHFYLGLADAAVPSVLLLDRDQIMRRVSGNSRNHSESRA